MADLLRGPCSEQSWGSLLACSLVSHSLIQMMLGAFSTVFQAFHSLNSVCPASPRLLLYIHSCCCGYAHALSLCP